MKGGSVIPVQNLVNEEIRSQSTDREHPHWHVSQLWRDPCEQYLERIGEEPDEKPDDRLLRVFHVGNVFEEWILGLLKPKVDKIDQQTDLYNKELDVAGHPDAIVTYGDVTRVYEIKTINSRAFWHLKREGKTGYDHHKMQLWMYLYMTGIEEGHLIYISKDDLCIDEYPVFLENGDIKKKCLDTLDYLNECWKKQIYPKPIEDKEDIRYKYNNYKDKCKAILKSGEYYEQTN